MKEKNAVIGGEGNGGIIYPDLHYGRDSLVGAALFLTHLAKEGKTVSELRAGYPSYFMGKKKIELTPEINVDDILAKMESNKWLSQTEIDSIDEYNALVKKSIELANKINKQQYRPNLGPKGFP